MAPRPLVIAVLAILPLGAGCGSGASAGKEEEEDGGGSPTPTPEPTPTPGTVDHLTADATWTGETALARTLVVDAGVTLTIAPGATVRAAPGAQLRVEGTLLAQNGAITVFEGSGGTWGGVVAAGGGVVEIHDAEIRGATTGFASESGAGLSKLVSVVFSNTSTPLRLAASTKVCRASLAGANGSSQVTAGTATFVDSDLLGSGGDTLVFSGGEIVLSHVHLGAESHCLLHGGGTSATLDVDKTVFDNAAYAFMLSNLSTATVRNSRVEMGTMSEGGISSSSVTLDARENWWGSPSGFPGTAPAGWNVSSPVTSATDPRVVDAGPRPAGSGCESDPSF